MTALKSGNLYAKCNFLPPPPPPPYLLSCSIKIREKGQIFRGFAYRVFLNLLNLTILRDLELGSPPLVILFEIIFLHQFFATRERICIRPAPG